MNTTKFETPELVTLLESKEIVTFDELAAYSKGMRSLDVLPCSE